jgi:hypothetical protein
VRTTSDVKPPRTLDTWILGAQLVLFVLYAGFWVDPHPSSDVTLDVVVFLAGPFVFGGLLLLALRLRRTRDASPVLRGTYAAGNALNALCLAVSVVFGALWVLADLVF